MSEILIVIDYQKDFADGELGFTKAASLEHHIYEKVQIAQSSGKNIFFTFDTHYDNYLETSEGKHLPIPHCIYGTKGWHLHGKLVEFEKEHPPLVNKVMKKAFGSISLPFIINDICPNLTAIEMCGIVTNICVISNAIILKSYYHEVPITVDAACCAAPDEKMHESSLDIMAGMGIKIINRS